MLTDIHQKDASRNLLASAYAQQNLNILQIHTISISVRYYLQKVLIVIYINHNLCGENSTKIIKRNHNTIKRSKE